MKLPSELTVPMRIRAQRKHIRRNPQCAPITGAYCVTSRDRRSAELTAIVEKLPC